MKSSLKSTVDPTRILPMQPELPLIGGRNGANGNDSPPAKPVKTGASHGSAFTERGFQATIAALHEEIRALYTADPAPWIIGYSGGKDSTATLQLIWSAIADLPPEQRRKTIHVISTDTLVENPIVAAWVATSLEVMQRAAAEQEMPVRPRRLTPKISNSFWVNLIGRGYPARATSFAGVPSA